MVAVVVRVMLVAVAAVGAGGFEVVVLVVVEAFLQLSFPVAIGRRNN